LPIGSFLIKRDHDAKFGRQETIKSLTTDEDCKDETSFRKKGKRTKRLSVGDVDFVSLEGDRIKVSLESNPNLTERTDDEHLIFKSSPTKLDSDDPLKLN